MPNMIIASSERKLNEKGFNPLIRKLQTTSQLLKENDKLIYFFESLFAHREMQFPSDEQSTYLNSLFDEIIETLPETATEDVDTTIFCILLRYNFNHESVRKYYVSEIDHYVTQNPRKVNEYLEKVMSYCRALDRKDIGYNKYGHTLRQEIGHHTKLRMEQADIFRPFKVLLNGNTFFPLMRLLVETKVFEEMEPSDLWDSMAFVFRDKRGRRFACNTVRHRYGIDAESNLEELKEVLENVHDLLEHKMKVRQRPARGKGLL